MRAISITVICKECFKDVVFIGLGLSIQSSQIKQGSIQSVLQVGTTVGVLEGMSENAAEEEVEQYSGKDAALFHYIGHVKGSKGDAIGTGKDWTC